MKFQNANVWAGIAVFIYAIVIFLQSTFLHYYTKFGPGPGFFPLWLSGILILLSIAWIWISLRKEVILFKEILPKGKDLPNVLSVLVSLLVFMLIVNVSGFVIACSMLLFIVFINGYKWYVSFMMSLCVSILLFFVFKYILEVPLPVNIFGW